MTKTIEDLLEELDEIIRGTSNVHILTNSDKKFICDLCQRTRTGGNFSTKQAGIAKKIIKKHAKYFSFSKNNKLTEEEVYRICDTSLYRNTPYVSTDVPRRVRVLGNRKLGFQSKYSPQIIEKIKTLSDPVGPSKKEGFPYFNKKYKIWVVEVTENNLEKIIKFIKKFNFEFDDDVVQFLTDCTNSINQQSTAKIENDTICVTIQNNDLLARWITDILLVEEEMNV